MLFLLEFGPAGRIGRGQKAVKLTALLLKEGSLAAAAEEVELPIED